MTKHIVVSFALLAVVGCSDFSAHKEKQANCSGLSPQAIALLKGPRISLVIQKNSSIIYKTSDPKKLQNLTKFILVHAEGWSGPGAITAPTPQYHLDFQGPQGEHTGLAVGSNFLSLGQCSKIVPREELRHLLASFDAKLE